MLYAGDNAAEGTVGLDERHECLDSEDYRGKEENPNRIAEPGDFLRRCESVFLAFAAAANVGHYVLEDTERADN